MPERTGLRARWQELAEMGPAGLAFRARWEAMLRSGAAAALERPPPQLAPAALPDAADLAGMLPFDAAGVARLMADRLGPAERKRLARAAALAAEGRVLAFGRWLADFGSPPDWHLNPVNGRRWTASRHWSRSLGEERRVGDVKLTWEIGRFPHAYDMARAAAHEPASTPGLGQALADQVSAFAEATPFGRGVHWSSGQEIAFRLMAWLFALGAFGPASTFAASASVIARALHDGASHVERHVDYTLKAVYNNHLLSEALALLLAGECVPLAPAAARWREQGLAILTAQADRQLYPDGGYIQLSHNYERVAIQVYLWAVALLRRKRREVPEPWLSALGRAVDFLHAQQNPADGRLPNYGANDGALPSPLTSCDYSDFRPTLQAASLASRGERLYRPGLWDEEAAWMLGPASLDAPLRPRPRKSVSFRPTGFHLLRGRDEATFAALRCGTIRDRFSQIDMLHLDVWWRGENVLVDPGTYLYNGPPAWHEHFMTTAAHNTVTVDGRDQMLHFRRFKNLYWTRAELLRFEDAAEWAVAEGEHHGYARHPGRCVHRRAVLFVRDGLWVVVDRLHGDGAHQVRLHWLGGPYPHAYDAAAGRLVLTTPVGGFEVAVLDGEGAAVAGDVVAGRAAPPRGWLSRYYGEKTPVPSLAVERKGPLPLTLVSLLSGGRAEVNVSSGVWSVTAAGARARFRISEGRFEDVRVEPP